MAPTPSAPRRDEERYTHLYHSNSEQFSRSKVMSRMSACSHVDGFIMIFQSHLTNTLQVQYYHAIETGVNCSEGNSVSEYNTKGNRCEIGWVERTFADVIDEILYQ